MTFLLAFLLTFTVQATTLKFFNAAIGYTEYFELSNDNKKVTMEKNSNFKNQNDMSLGLFKTSDSTQEIFKELEKLSVQLKGTEEVLNKAGTSHTIVAKPPLHGPRFDLDGFKVYPDSPTFTELENIFQKSLKLKWALVDGISLDRKNKKYLHFKKSEKVKEEVFEESFFCENKNLPSRCLARTWGSFYLEKTPE